MAAPHHYGPDPERAVRHEEVLRDTRSVWQMLLDALGDPLALPVLLALLALAALMVPEASVAIGPAALIGGLVGIARIRRATLPLRLPRSSGRIDYGDRLPSAGRRARFAKASGILYLGTALRKGRRQELWLAAKDLVTHMLVFGTTGAGKTETLLSVLSNYIGMGSGFYYVDAKGDKSLLFKVAGLARYFGRDDDLRVLNFSTSSLDPSGAAHGQRRRSSNYMNPFSYGRHDALTNVIVSLIDVPTGGDNVVFGQNAISVVTAMMKAAVALRDIGVPLTIRNIRERLTLAGMVELMEDQRISGEARAGIRSFLDSLGYDFSLPPEEQGRRGGSDVVRQFGYARAYFNRTLTSLIDVYGYIFGEDYGEIDGRDAIYQGRIVVGVLPSLEKAEEELRNLGKITLSSLRFALASAMGDKTVGTKAQVLGTLPAQHRVPYAIAVDEYAAIPTPGFILAVTQGRSYGIACIIGTQDFAGLKRNSEAEAGQAVANCKVKMFMAQEDPRDTLELARGLAGRDLYSESAGSHIDRDRMLALSYRDRLQVDLRERDNADLRDLKEQVEGEFHLFFKDRMVRGQAFYANVPIDDRFQLRIPELLMMQPPSAEEISARYGAVAEVASMLRRRIHNDVEERGEDAAIDALWAAVRKAVAAIPGRGVDAAVAGVMAYEAATRELIKAMREEALGGVESEAREVEAVHEAPDAGPASADAALGRSLGRLMGEGDAASASSSLVEIAASLDEGTEGQLPSGADLDEEDDADVAANAARAAVERAEQLIEQAEADAPPVREDGSDRIDDLVKRLLD